MMLLYDQSAFALWMAQLLGTLPMVAVAVGVTPLISQIPTLPLVSRQRMSDMPSPLKSPVSAMLQAAGTLPMPEVEATAVPLRSQIPTLPLVSRQSRSLLPSPLKSPVPTIVQLVGALPTTAR